MTSFQQLPLYNKLYIFLKILYKTVHNIPKEYKYSIGNEILLISWKCLDLFLEANALPNEKKYGVISKLSLEFDKVKIRLRMMQEIRIISLGEYTHFQENYLQEIGTMIGGWLKWSKNCQGAGVTY